MSPASASFRQTCGPRGLSLLLILISAAAAGFTAGCGGGNAPVLKGNTNVTLMLSGTANDQLVEFDLGIQSLTLTSQSGKMVNLLSAEQGTEYIHINGGIEPLAAVTIPQGIYTSATATIGGAQFTCVQLAPGTLDTSTFAYGQTPQSNVTVNLPTPMTITGDNMGLLLNLLVAQSASYSACYNPNGIITYSITPHFQSRTDHAFVPAHKLWERQSGGV